MPNLYKADKDYIIDYLKRKSYVLVGYDGIIIEPDEIESDVIIDFHGC